MGFFSLSKALSDVKDALGAKDTAIAGIKLLGKGVVNTAQFVATTGVDSVLKAQSKAVLNKEGVTEEQKAKAIEAAEWADKRIDARREKTQKDKQSQGSESSQE